MDNISGLISPSGIKISGLISQAVLRGLSAYQIAVANGFDGTQAEWLQSLRGESIQFRSEGLTIYYKYESDEEWTTLVQIDQLMADYSVLDNKPTINGIELNGNQTLDDLGIQAKGNYVEEQTGYGLISDVEKERLSHVDNYDDTEVKQAIESIILNAVTGIKGAAEAAYRKGNVNITPENIGLGNVDNTHDADKNVLSAVQDSEGNKIDETYFSGISESGGEVFLTRPDGSNAKLMNSEHNHDASEIVSGTIDIARLPAGALDRLITVQNRTERYALTRDRVQNGDTVQQLDTGVMYRVVDDNQLNRAAGYKEYTAGRASAVPWSGIEDKPATYAPSAHTHEIADITDIANASVAEAGKLKTIRYFSLSGGATAEGVAFDGTGNVVLNITALDASLLSGTAPISITGNAATATQFARERTIEVTGKATAAPKVYDGRQNIALEITDLDAAEKNHKHSVADITDIGNLNTSEISDFETSNTDNFSDMWFSDPLKVNKPVHNSGVQYNPVKDILKVGAVQGNLKGNADTATALTSDAGSATQPIYFANGKPVATTYQLNKTVPADAVFTDTDTHYASNIVVAGNFNAKVDTTTALTNGNVYINHIQNGQVTSSRKITGTGTTTVTTDEFGNLIINATGQTFTEGAGISISNNIITNTGVRSISASTERGNITANINGVATNIPVYGLGTAAYTDSSDYATANHRHSFADIQNKPTTLAGYGITDAVSANHGHDASDITSGTIDIARLPAGALEKLVTVANEAARYMLTVAQVQNGDTVQQEDTGVMYRVVDDTNLNNASGYRAYVAGMASSVPWTGVTGKPETYTPSVHSHTVSDISDIATATVGKANQLATARTIALTGAVTGSGSFDGSGDLTINTVANHTHQYAGSQTIGGPANSAVRLETSSAGSYVVPVYFYEGKPVAMDYQLNKSVPADAVFTDTHYSSTTVINSAEDSTSNSTRAISNGNVFINHVENGVVKSSHRIEGTGTVTVTYNAQGDLIINGVGGGTSGPVPNPYALTINGTTYDGSVAVDVGVIDVAHGGTGNTAVDTSPTLDSTRMVTSGGLYNALQGKANANHTHNYAGANSSGGAALSAEKLNSNAGSATQPVYFSQGKPVATDYELNATVPANAVFTDTHHTSGTVVTNSAEGTANTSVTITNGNLFLNHIENGAVRSSHRITGTGSVTVKSDSSGNIVINAEDTKYTVLPNPFSLSINGKSYDGSENVDVGIIDVAHGGTGNSTVDTEPTEDSTKMVTSGGVYAAIQGKADANHTHNYAGSSSAGGSATSAVKLDSNAGSATQPVFFSGGKPTATTYELNATVPADALFTDTHYASKTVVAGNATAITNTTSTLANTRVYINHVENNAVVSSHKISGTGAASVTTDISGNIIINAEDTKYTNLPNPFALTIQAGGITLGTYDGSSAESFNITCSSIGAAAASHSHAWSDLSSHPTTIAGYGITDQLASKTHVHDASEIQSGVLDIARIPVSALELLIVVADQTAMYALTTNDVQIGDTVQREDTGVMYRVIDDTNLDNANGYKEYTAGSASSVPWSGITGKPDVLTRDTKYAGSLTVGGSANSAVKLDSDGGSATQPVYFAGGKPTPTTYELNATVPANAVFTDTHHQAKLITTNSATGTTQTTTVINNQDVRLNVIENGEVRSSHRIIGSGATTVRTDSSGNILISSTDNDTKPSPGDGIDVSSSYVITNTGVRSIAEGSTNGTISVNTNGTSTEVSVHGLGTAAFTAATAYASSGHDHPLSITKTPTAVSGVELEEKAIYTLTAGGKTYVFKMPGDTKYSEGDGISLNGTTISNSGVRSISSGTANGTISVNTGGTTADVAVTGLGSAAFKAETYFSKSDHTHNYAGASAPGGAATSALKLASEQEIKVNLSSVYDASTNHPTFAGNAAFEAPITGTLGVAHGGTGKTTLTANGVLYGAGTGNIGATNAGAPNTVLMGNGTNTAPGFVAISGLTVGKASTLETARQLKVVLNSTTYPTFDGHEAVEIGIANTLPVSHGGTGLTTITANGLLYGNGTNEMNILAPGGTAGMVLTTNGANVAPSWVSQSSLIAGSADKLTSARTISLTGMVTGSVSTNFNANASIATTIDLATGDSNGQVKIAGTNVSVKGLGAAAYLNTTDTPTPGSNTLVKSSGVHKRIAYKKILLSTSGWHEEQYDRVTGKSFYRQGISVGTDITANTEIVSVKLDGSMANGYTTVEYSQSFTGDGSTLTFTLDHMPSGITQVRSDGVSTQAYSLSGNKITMNTVPGANTTISVVYYTYYMNAYQFSHLSLANTVAGGFEFEALEKPLIPLTVIVGYVQETLDVVSTQATLTQQGYYSPGTLFTDTYVIRDGILFIVDA